MSLAYTSYIWPLIIAAMVTIVVTVAAVQRRHVPGAKSLAGLTAALTWWLVSYAFEVSGQNVQTLIFWSNLAYVGIVSVPVFWVAFAIEYSGRGRWLTWRNSLLLFAVPVITQIIIWADPVLHIFRTDVELVVSNSLITMQPTRGLWFWVHTAYSYGLIILGMVLLARVFMRSSGLYRRQAATIFSGALVAMLANILFVFVFTQVFVLDPTPFSFVVTGLTLALGLFRFRLLDVVPVARDAVIEGMHDGILVLDMQDRVVDINLIAQQGLGHPMQDIIGQPIQDVFPESQQLVTGDVDSEEIQLGLTMETAGTSRYYDINLSPLYSRQRQLIGRLMVLHDVTERKLAEQALERWIAQFQILPALAQEIASERVLDDLLEHAADLVRERFDAYHIGIFLTDESSEYAILRAASGAAAKNLLAREEQWSLEGLGGVREDALFRVIRRGQTLYHTGDDEMGIMYGYEPLLSQVRSEIILPLRFGLRSIGALMIQSIQPDPFAQNARAILQTVADQLAVAVENARLLEQMTLAMREMERTSGQYTEQAWRGLAEDAAQPLGYRYHRQELEPITEDTEALHPAEDGLLEVPITLRDQNIGILHLRFPEAQVASNVAPLVQEVANRLAMTLESARLYQDTQRRAAREQTIGEVSSRIRETLELEDMLKIAASEIRQALNLGDFVIRLDAGEQLFQPEMPEQPVPDGGSEV